MTVDPKDDVGADTLQRFFFQAHLVAARCISMMLDDRIKAVICEWHEDYVVQFANGPSELVSVKHHDSNQAKWSVKELCLNGGLKHLFGRFQALGEKCTCRLQTNEHLQSGTGKCGELRDACTSENQQDLERWANLLTAHIGSNDGAAVTRFLTNLKIEDHLPDRDQIGSIHIHSLMPRLGRSLSIPDSAHRHTYQQLVQLALSASSSPEYECVMETLCNPRALDSDGAKRRSLAAKTIDRERALEALAPTQTSHRLLSAKISPAPARTRLVKKLEAGGVGPTVTSMARRLKANWDSYQEDWSSGLPGDTDTTQHLRTKIVYLAGIAEAGTRRQGTQYGQPMLLRLRELIAENGDAGDWPGPLDQHLLLGLAFERTEACEIFWSDAFDPDTVP